ncbi:MAG: hypothetical protein IKL04_00490 [Lachnospiraceae bacterium]|nr:hypothetical protein [Lachnospiraceae bacterium]
MNEKRILELFNNINEEYIEEARPQNRKKRKLNVYPIAIAACLCLLAIGGFGLSYFMQSSDDEKYYTTNIEEILSVYEGKLLAENISYDSANDTQILLCYTGDDLPLSSDRWQTLSVSASYEDYDMTLNCAFNGETFTASDEKVIDTIQYGDTTIQIYQGETTPEFELTYYAVFEYQNVCYELKTYSNDKERIYEILQAVLGVNEEDAESSSNGEHDFTDVLGYSDYHVTVDQNMPGFIIQKYYIETDGVEKCIAQIFGYAVPGPEVYSRDLDGDGINELICNCIYGTGARRVYIYRNNDGVIEIGRLSYDLWDSTMFPGITNMGASYIEENYIAETNTFEIAYPTETAYESIILEDMTMFEFEEFVEDF